MNSKDDSILYSGVNDLVSSKMTKKSKRELINEKNREDKAKLLPAEEVVFKVIKNQENMLGEQLLALVKEADTEESIRMKLEAVRLHRQWLINLKSKLHEVLRSKTPEEREQERKNVRKAKEK